MFFVLLLVFVIIGLVLELARDTFGLDIIGIIRVFGVGLIVSIVLYFVVSFFSFNVGMDKIIEQTNALKNQIQIEQDEIQLTQERMKDIIDEYVEYEEETNKTAMSELDPKIVLNIYPELKSSAMFNQLNRDYLKSMRNIKTAKMEYNEHVSDYNKNLVTLTGRIFGKNRSRLEYLK